MKITVILCTYNRCQSLAKALESVLSQTLLQSDEWEVLVVDNNSNDQTREVVDDFCRQHPNRFRYLFEPQPGKSYALNAGIREANGDVLAFMDDDVTVEPTWLHNLTAMLLEGKWAGAGGRILPERTFTPPRWLHLEGRYASAPFALFDVGPEAGPLSEPPFGTNMAFLKSMFQKHGGFRTDLGPCPGSEIRSEDTEFGSRLLAAGEQLFYQPSAIVYHPVAQSRLQKQYFLSWWFDKGRADVRQLGISPDAVCVLGVPLNLFQRLAVLAIHWLVAVKSSRRFNWKVKVWWKMGEIVECYRQSRDARMQQRECNVRS